MSRSPAVILYDANGNPLAFADGAAVGASAHGLLAMGASLDGTAHPVHCRQDGTLAVESQDYLYHIAEGHVPDHALWQINTKATIGSSARLLVTEGTWVVQTAGARRSIASSSASDSSAGTGARKVRLLYISSLDGTEKQEVLTLAGTTPVNTVATDIQNINAIQVIAAGSVGVTVGTLTLYATTAGGGGAIAQVGVGESISNTATYWVPTNKRLYVVSLQVYTSLDCEFELERTVDYSALGGGSSVRDIIAHKILGAKQAASESSSGYPAPLIVGPGQRFAFYVANALNSTVTGLATGWIEVEGSS